MTEDKFSDTSGMNWVTTVPKPEIPTIVIKYHETKCLKCDKPTRSHKYKDQTFLCHGCYEKMTEEERNDFQNLHNTRQAKQ